MTGIPMLLIIANAINENWLQVPNDIMLLVEVFAMNGMEYTEFSGTNFFSKNWLICLQAQNAEFCISEE